MPSQRWARPVRPPTWQAAAAALLGGVLAVTGLSCRRNEGSQVPLHPVQGQVFFKGKAPHRAVVWFHPLGPSDFRGAPPRGVVAEDGSFQMSTFKTHDGAPVGHYRVTISWKKVGAADEEGPELLPARYQHPANTELPTVEIKEGENVLPPFQLTDR
jgi:hypothetical protein